MNTATAPSAPSAPAAPSASRRIAGTGTPEQTWAAWPGLASTRRASLDVCVKARERLVVVAPHPDDEVLACGGLLASHLARGGKCLVIAVTDGEASHAGSPTVEPVVLGETRRGESVKGLAALGVPRSQIVRLGLPDGAVKQHTDQLLTGLHILLQPSDVVVSTWRFDGHPDHEATGSTIADVVSRVQCRFLEAPVWMWHWAQPSSPQIPWKRLVAFELGDEAFELKRQALALHQTQLSPRDGLDPEPVLGAEILQRALRRFEYFFVGD